VRSSGSTAGEKEEDRRQETEGTGAETNPDALPRHASSMIGFLYAALLLGVLLILFVGLPSIHRVGPTEVGLVTKRFSAKKLTGDNPIAFGGEAGCQAELLMPGLRWKLALLYSVQKFPWVQIPAGEIGVVIAQIGKPLPIGAKSAA
jgi:uncharacterized membrane protein YqiK